MRNKKYLFLGALLLPIFCLSACTQGGGKHDSSSGGQDVQLSSVASACQSTLDVYESMYVTIHLKDTVTPNNVEGLSFTANSRDTSGITLSAIQDNGDVNAFSTGKTGDFVLDITALVNDVAKLNYEYTINVVDNSPVPVKIKDIPDQEIEAPKLINGKTNYDLTIDLAEYVDASDYVSYQMECLDNTVSMSMDGKKATFNFTTFGQKAITIKCLLKGQVQLELSFKAKLVAKVDKQLFNGDFEKDWSGWDADEWDKTAYSIYDSPTDIWGNFVNNDNKYLYGYYNEAGTAEFSSSLFKVDGIRLVTFLMAGNGTNDLQFRLMKYVDGTNDELVATYNNWYYPKYSGSGFIMRNYYFYIPEANNGDTMYFTVYDNRTEDFGFICLDNIVTYYDAVPSGLDNFYQAGYCTDPSGSDLDMRDTSKDPFTPLADVTYQLPNGDFESGYDHWFMTTADKNAYAIYGSKTDIWGNVVNATKNYLYGYADESYTTTFHSDLFKVGGTGLITFKLAGFHTQDLQFRLVKYNESGDDVIIETFNNWYCNPDVRSWSGFIMQNYYYRIDLSQYRDAYCYFEVYDMKQSNFGFICLDDIITYYEEDIPASILIEENNYYPAGYINDPR